MNYYDFYLNDKGRFALLLSISLALGYLVACATVVFVRPRGARLAFIKEKGFKMAMVVLVAFPSASLAGLFYGCVVTLICRGSQFTADARFMIVGACAALSFVGLVIYGAVHVIKS
jgi:hypothetical protein